MHITVIRLGGMLLNTHTSMIRFFNSIYSYYQTFNQNILVLHGGNYWSQSVINQLEYKNKKSHLFRIFTFHDNTIENFLKIGILSGTINKYLINQFSLYKINSIGLCLTDINNMVLDVSKLDDVIYSKNGSSKLIEYFFSCNIIPIISPIGITKENKLIILDSDFSAMLLSIFFNARLILLTDVSSVLDGKGNRIKELSEDRINQLISEGIITTDMINKVKIALRFSNYLNQPVDISGWQNLNNFKLLLNGHSTGTRIFPNN